MVQSGVKTAKVKLGTVDGVKRFNNIVTKREENIDLVSGRFVIDAKSIMGIFSLDLSKVVEVAIHTDSDEVFQNFLSDIDSFLVKED